MLPVALLYSNMFSGVDIATENAVTMTLEVNMSKRLSNMRFFASTPTMIPMPVLTRQ